MSDVSAVKALVFDVFGTVVDWRTSLISDFTKWSETSGIEADWTALVDGWRAVYSASMDEVRKHPERIALMGVSMGGMVAQEVALRAPQRVRTLTLGCTYAGGEGSLRTDPAVVQRLGQLFMAGRMGEAMSELIRFNVSERFASDAANLEPFKQIASQLPASLDVLLAQFQAVGGHDASARLGRIAAPTLVVHGSDDRILPVANARAIAARVPGARLEILDGVGHLFWWERPQRSAQLVRELAQPASARQ